MNKPYAMTQLTKDQWNYILFLVRTEREKILECVPDTKVRTKRIDELQSILVEIERTVSNSPDLK